MEKSAKYIIYISLQLDHKFLFYSFLKYDHNSISSNHELSYYLRCTEPTKDDNLNRNTDLVRRSCAVFDSRSNTATLRNCFNSLTSGVKQVLYGQCGSVVYKSNGNQALIKESVCRLMQSMAALCGEKDWRMESGCGK